MLDRFDMDGIDTIRVRSGQALKYPLLAQRTGPVGQDTNAGHNPSHMGIDRHHRHTQIKE